MTELIGFEGAGERYKFLLQPVKDLATNWDLDIAKTLEEYIRKVVEETVDAASNQDDHGRRKVFNFAEAALLIHGTTTVYVRKVEYVLQQAQNFFEQLRESNREEAAPKGAKRLKGAQQQEDGAIEMMEGGEEGNDENADPNGERRRCEKQQSKINYAAVRNLLERLSQRRSPLLPVVPIAFFPLSDFEKTNVPLCTRTNSTEVIGKKDDFKINACHIHESVAVLDLKSIPLINQFSHLSIEAQQQKGNSRATSGALEPLLERTELESGLDLEVRRKIRSSQQKGTSRATSGALGPLLERTELESGLEDGVNEAVDININDGANDDDEFEDPIDELVAEEIINLPPGEDGGSELDPDEHHNLDDILEVEDLENSLGGMQNLYAGFEHLTASQRKRNIGEKDLLDPMELVTERSRPFRRKENCVMNAVKQIRARDRRIERDCREKKVPNVATVKCYIDTRIYRHKMKKRTYAVGQFNTFLIDQAVLALNPLIHEEEKRRAELRKKRRKEIQTADRAARAARRASQLRELDPVLDHPADDDEGEEEQNDAEGRRGEQNGVNEAVDININDGANDDDEFEDPIDELVAEEIINFPPGEDWGSELDPDEHHNLGDILEVEDLENSLGGVQNLYAGFEHLTASQRKRNRNIGEKHKHFNLYDDTMMVGEGDPLNPDELPPRPISQMDYDEIIAFHLRKYWTASSEAVSAFSERMQQWEARMVQQLEEEQTHREFSTRDYGDELLERFDGQIGGEIDFTKMLGALPNSYDRSRYLLVSLILTNMHNVEIEFGKEVKKKRDDDDENAPPANDNMSMMEEEEEAVEEAMETGQTDEGGDDGEEEDPLKCTTRRNCIRLKLLKLERHHQVFEEEQRLLDGGAD